MLTPEDDLSFLPFLIDEDLYLIESVAVFSAEPTPAEPKVEAIKSAPPQAPISQPHIPVLPKIETPKQEIPVSKPIVSVHNPVEIKPVAVQLIAKKVIIMVGYQGIATVPANVKEALEKIFSALGIDMLQVEIMNVLATNAPKIENYTFEYLILMGGNGKNIAFMQNYAGTRNRYDIAKHAGKTVFFAEAMDVYLKDVELKKKFWEKLKEVFGKTKWQSVK